MPKPTLPRDLDAFFAANAPRLRGELDEFLRIPSISASSAHAAEMGRAADWLVQQMRSIGLAAERLETAGHPAVIGEWRGAPGAPTLLIYGHYDVQPPEPLELWTSPPFEPQERDGKLFARGSVDDKGQLFLHLKALEAHLRVRGTLPVNVVVLAEGEEEVGSPSILYALRGLAYFQIDVQGPAGDLHSGMYGGAVVNPATALARIIASFHDDEGRIAIPGFYDDVQAWTDEERLALRNLPHEDDAFRAGVGAPALGGEAGYTTLERLWARPTCEVNGLLSGYTGEGAKTVLPAKAMAKVSFRLVPNQDPERVEQLLRTHVARIAPEGVAVTVTALHGAHPWKADLSGPVFEAAARALEAAYGRPPVFTGEGGSIPIVRTFQERLGAPVLLMGFGLPGENAHAPDEWIAVENLEKGMRASAALYEGYAERTAPRG